MAGRPLPAVADVGIVGGGQLARMTAQAAIPLGLHLRILAARSDDSAALVCPDVVVGSPDDADTLSAFARDCRIVTFDHELVPAAALARLDAEGACLRPSAATLKFAQDKRWQRERLGTLGFPVPPHLMASQPAEVAAFAEEHQWPIVAKTPRGGYDGRGVWIADNAQQVEQLFGTIGGPLLIEPWLPIEREVAILVARRPGGQTATFPVVETVQVDGICREVIAPAPIPASLATEAEVMARAIADAIALVGVMAVELFVTQGRLIVNELATRPHNSGHYSIEGSTTSQFEQHLRAVLDWPLGVTAMTAPSVVTINVLGGPESVDPRDVLPRALAVSGDHVHLYGKVPRPGRKLGHVTALGIEPESTRARAIEAASILSGVSQEAKR